MLAVTRHRVSESHADDFHAAALRALETLAQRPGFVAGRVGRAADDPGLWVVTSEWEDVGSYRRALSAYEVKVDAIPLLSNAIDEPTAFEVLAAVDETGSRSSTTARAADADVAGPHDATPPASRTEVDGRG
jgi:quinol monooxygenase YgiN